MKEKIFVIGIRKKGIFKKIKWKPNHAVISMENYLEYKKLKKKPRCRESISIKYHCCNCGTDFYFIIYLPIQIGDTYFARCPSNHHYKLTMEVSEMN